MKIISKSFDIIYFDNLIFTSLLSKEGNIKFSKYPNYWSKLGVINIIGLGSGSPMIVAPHKIFIQPIIHQ